MAEVGNGRWISSSEAARRLKLSGDYVRDLCDAGRLRVQRTALGRLIHAASVERFRREREARQTDGK